MRRRKFLAMGSTSAFVGVSGCIDQIHGSDSDDDGNGKSDPEEEYYPMDEIRDAACTPVPDDEAELDYTSREYEDVTADLLIDMEDEEPREFVFISTAEEAESRLNPDLKGRMWSFIEETNFSDQALLAWDGTWTNTSQSSEVVGVTQPDTETIHAYLCQYGSAGGTASTEYAYLISVDVSQEPQQAKLTFREASGHRKEDPITTREETYESR